MYKNHHKNKGKFNGNNTKLIYGYLRCFNFLKFQQLIYHQMK